MTQLGPNDGMFTEYAYKRYRDDIIDEEDQSRRVCKRLKLGTFLFSDDQEHTKSRTTEM